MNSFKDFKLLPTIQETLVEKKLTVPTEIQTKTIPLILEGRSVVGVAETGSGKTLSYALPILHLLKELENAKDSVEEERRPRAVVIVPTRELGEQVSRVFKPFTHTTRLRVRTVLGGTTLEVAKRNISGKFEILVATSGRLVKLLDRRLIDLSDVRFLVFDEADQMLDQGFLPDALQITNACGDEGIHLSLFSATIPDKLQELISKIFKNAEVIRTEGSHRTVSTLSTKNLNIVDGKRFPVLEKILKEKTEGGTLVFTNTREQCDTLALELNKIKFPCLIYRGEMEKVERRSNLKKFRDGKINLMISTDLASRGLDVEHVGRVINYHLPMQIENYLHRVGRTARAGREGLVINFVTKRDLSLIRRLDNSQSAPRGEAKAKK